MNKQVTMVTNNIMGDYHHKELVIIDVMNHPPSLLTPS